MKIDRYELNEKPGADTATLTIEGNAGDLKALARFLDAGRMPQAPMAATGTAGASANEACNCRSIAHQYDSWWCPLHGLKQRRK